MKTRHSRLCRQPSQRTGATCVEMALVAPTLFLIVFGLFEIAIGYMVHHFIQDAARQGCRVAVCYGATNSAVLAKVNSLLQAESVSGATTTILVNNAVGDVASAKATDQITVKITVPASKVTPFPTTGYLQGTLMALCTMRHD